MVQKSLLRRWLQAVLILPFNVLVVFPALILYFTRCKTKKITASSLVWAAVFFVPGAILALYTMLLFNRKGKGTPAPWDPPVNLITTGPYKYVRNPMITAVLLMLTGESSLLRSKALAIYTVTFFLQNCLYFHFFEEKQLQRRFGKAYSDYKASTPMWLPALKVQKSA